MLIVLIMCFNFFSNNLMLIFFKKNSWTDTLIKVIDMIFLVCVLRVVSKIDILFACPKWEALFAIQFKVRQRTNYGHFNNRKAAQP